MKEVKVKLKLLKEDLNGVCPGYQKVIYRTKGVECEACLNWFHLSCSKISESDYANIATTVWFCRTCLKQQ